jgi:hypothetical protein
MGEFNGTICMVKGVRGSGKTHGLGLTGPRCGFGAHGYF